MVYGLVELMVQSMVGMKVEEMVEVMDYWWVTMMVVMMVVTMELKKVEKLDNMKAFW